MGYQRSRAGHGLLLSSIHLNEVENSRFLEVLFALTSNKCLGWERGAISSGSSATPCSVTFEPWISRPIGKELEHAACWYHVSLLGWRRSLVGKEGWSPNICSVCLQVSDPVALFLKIEQLNYIAVNTPTTRIETFLHLNTYSWFKNVPTLEFRQQTMFPNALQFRKPRLKVVWPAR